MSFQQIIEEGVQNSKVIVFGKSYCRYTEGEAIPAYLLEKTGQYTVPNVFVNKTHLGGSDDLTMAESDGTFQKLHSQ
ncbi:hypothetical protein INT46_008128 [Mucor plumbeus]|uniref:Glutaredoxin n=1 Tax=Mucor plumbeus TaxID=97098 RepID=A0A8H7UWT3_9FUNG|nr:hypothetical protein INT46_008128 [Mucor plumbeus]